MPRVIQESSNAEVTSYGVDSFDVIGADEKYHNFAFLKFNIIDAESKVIGSIRKSYEMGVASDAPQGVGRSIQDFKAFVPQLAIERQTVIAYYQGN